MLSAAFQPCIGRGLLAYWFSNFHALEKPKDWGVCLAMIRRALGPTRETCCCCCCCCFSFNLMQPRRMDAPLIAVKVRKGFEPLSDVEGKQSHRQKHKEQLSSDQPQEKKNKADFHNGVQLDCIERANVEQDENCTCLCYKQRLCSSPDINFAQENPSENKQIPTEMLLLFSFSVGNENYSFKKRAISSPMIFAVTTQKRRKPESTIDSF